jgi:HSP20 family protein
MWLDVDEFLGDFDAMQRRMDQLFDLLSEGRRELLTMPSFDLGMGVEATVFDQGDSFLIEADLPGVALSEVNLEATEQGVVISGMRKLDMPEKARIHLQEREPWSFSKSFTLPVKIDSAKANAAFHAGVLKITLPKSAEAQPRRIQVHA